MDGLKDNVATQSLNSRALGVFMFVAGVIITFGTYGTGIVLGLPLMLIGIAFPIWRRSNLRDAHRPSYDHEMSQEQAARSGGVVMSRGEAAGVARAAHEETRRARAHRV